MKIELDYIGDFSALRRSMEATVENLSAAMLTINTAAEQVSMRAQALAPGSTRQAATLRQEVGKFRLKGSRSEPAPMQEEGAGLMFSDMGKY